MGRKARAFATGLLAALFLAGCGVSVHDYQNLVQQDDLNLVGKVDLARAACGGGGSGDCTAALGQVQNAANGFLGDLNKNSPPDTLNLQVQDLHHALIGMASASTPDQLTARYQDYSAAVSKIRSASGQ